MFFPLSTIKKFHAEIVFVVWLRDLSWAVTIVYLFFQESTSRKFFNLLFFYWPVFRLQILSASAIIFAECHGLSCVYVRASWCTALFRVSLRGVRLRSVGLAKKHLHAAKGQATRVPVFSLFSLFVFLFSLLHYHTCMIFLIPSARSLRFGSRLSKVSIDQKWNLFYHYLFQRTPVIYNFISQENNFIWYLFPLENETRSR